MTTVFLLQHVQRYEHDQPDDVKLIGLYMSADDAGAARARAAVLKGFRDQPDGFVIEAYRLGLDHWTLGFDGSSEGIKLQSADPSFRVAAPAETQGRPLADHETVFLLYHMVEFDDVWMEEDARTIGVYASHDAAQAAQKRSVALPGFAAYPDDFGIGAHRIGEDAWTGGFVTMMQRD